MLLSSLLLVPTIAHASTGQVNINGGNIVLSAQAPTTVSVPINIAGSDALNGFDIQVLADPTILSAASISLSGSILPSPTIVIECINGILVAGSTCAPQDGLGVVHLGAAHIGSLTAGTGLLFTINYNVVGNTPGTPISFNTGCTGTSVSGDCVTISNGSPTAVSETDLGTTFANLNDFTITPAFASISAPAGVSISDTINYVAKGAFSDLLSETVTGPCTLASGNPGTVDLTVPAGSDTLSCMSATNGDFTVTVTATGAFSGITHSANVALHVGPAGFSSSLNHNSITVPRGTSDSSVVVTFNGVSGFSGTVSITATGPAGITGVASPSMVTLTNDGSGNSKATSGLTVSVAGTVGTGTYIVAITGGAMLSVVVPGLDFSLAAVPTAIAVPRGGSVSSTISLSSIGSFAGTVSFTTAITVVATDPGTGVTNNIVPGFLPSTVTLTAGGSGITAWVAGTVKIGQTPNAANTATGEYLATITATSGSISHSVTIDFQVQDFSLGPNYCAGNTPINTVNSGSGEFPIAYVGEVCNTFTMTTQTVANGGVESNLWVQVSSLGGLQTNSATILPGIQSGDPTGPGRGRFVPELGFRLCFFQTFFANGTQLSPAYIQAHGPVVRGDPTDGCRGDGEAFPGDVAGTGPNIDFYVVTADALSTTLPGTYLVNVCGEIGTLVNCEMVTLIVVSPPVVHQFVYSHKVSLAAGGVQSFKLGVSNVDSHTVWAQVTVTGTGSLGHSFTATTGVFKINPNANANNLSLQVILTPAEKGETFTFTSSILVSAVDPGAVLFSNFSAGNNAYNGFFPPFTSSGISTAQSIVATFTVTA